MYDRTFIPNVENAGLLALEAQQAGLPHQVWGLRFWPARPHHNQGRRVQKHFGHPQVGCVGLSAPLSEESLRPPGEEPRHVRELRQRLGSFPLHAQSLYFLSSSVPCLVSG